MENTLKSIISASRFEIDALSRMRGLPSCDGLTAPLAVEIGADAIRQHGSYQKAVELADAGMLPDVILAAIWDVCPQARPMIVEIDRWLEKRVRHCA